MRHQFEYDQAGNIVQLLDQSPYEKDQPTWDAEFTYDHLYQLTSAHLDPNHESNSETLTYQYDQDGHLIQRSSSLSGVRSFNYAQGGDQLITYNDLSGSYQLNYDDRGNLIEDGFSYTWGCLLYTSPSPRD